MSYTPESFQASRASRILHRIKALVLPMMLPFVGHAALERTGPVDPANGFPAWYQDKTGLALEFLGPINASELAGGWTVLLPANTVAPEIFPSKFFPEHFYWAGTSDTVSYPMPANLGGGTQQAKLILGVQAGFLGINLVVPGTQLTFARIRIQIDKIPYSGDYKVFTPYGDFTFPNEIAGNRLRFTQDIGLIPGDFNATLSTLVGPYLLPSLTPGGAEMPPVTAANPQPDQDPAHFKGVFTPTPYPGTGKSYIADPARIGPVTGSPLPKFYRNDGSIADHNVFRIEGPVIPGTTNIFTVETSNFAVAGRVFTGAVPGNVEVTRASYTDDGAGDRRMDIYATATGATSGRVPAAPRPPVVVPSLWVYPAPPATDPVTGLTLNPLAAPAGVTPVPMLKSGNRYWSQIPVPSPNAFPTAVTISDAAALDAAGKQAPVFYQRRVTDDVRISSASFSPTNGGTLTVAATSSDKVAGGPQLFLDGFREILGGQLVLTNLMASPARVSVSSFAGGTAQMDVNTLVGMAADPSKLGYVAPAPVANNDSMVLMEDATVALNLLGNDALNSAGTVVITFLTQPTKGTVKVNPDYTVQYTPLPNLNGGDSFTYKVSVGGSDSNPATVDLFIVPVNDLPTAVNDAVSGVMGVPLQISPLINDTDPDGQADLNGVVIATAPVGATATAGIGGVISFTAAKPGIYPFTYRAVDLSGGASTNAATITATISDVVTVSSATLTTAKNSWAVGGTAYAGSVMQIVAVDAAGKTVATLGQATTNAKGAWSLSATVVVPTTAVRVLATSSNRGVGTLTITRK